MGERLSISLLVAGLPRLLDDDLAGVIDLARAAEAAGIDQIVLPDHLAIGPRTDRYPYGRFPDPEEPWLEPLTTLAAMAGATSRIRLGTGVLIAPLRPALLLAKTAATLDVLSNGRLDLGVGTGWQREEFAAAGVPFRGRTARMDDVLRACRALWRDAPASFASRTVSFERILCLPRPVQPGGPPIWIGGAATEGNLARLAEYGAGWMPIGLDDESFREGLAAARRALEAAGRDPAGLGVRATLAPVRGRDGRVDVEASLAALPRLRALGATAASVALPAFVPSAAEAPAFLERLARAER
jgi:probable F420-dependent oxidoreductase